MPRAMSLSSIAVYVVGCWQAGPVREVLIWHKLIFWGNRRVFCASKLLLLEFLIEWLICWADGVSKEYIKCYSLA